MVPTFAFIPAPPIALSVHAASLPPSDGTAARLMTIDGANLAPLLALAAGILLVLLRRPRPRRAHTVLAILKRSLATTTFRRAA
jgi:hypothetical protein